MFCMTDCNVNCSLISPTIYMQQKVLHAFIHHTNHTFLNLVSVLGVSDDCRSVVTSYY
jgi:hypothetical protein